MGIICLSAVVALAQTGTPKPSASSATAPSATTSPAQASVNVDESTLTLSESGNSAAPASQNIQSFGVWDLVRMIIILALVVAAIYGIFYLIRRGNSPKVNETQLIKLMGSQGLPGNRWLHLVSVQKQVFLIGSSDSSVNLISEISDQESADELRLMASQEEPTGKKNFADLIGSMFGGGKGPKTPTAGSTESKNRTALPMDFLKRQRDRLKKL